MKTLVVYFSRTGHTRRVAEGLARALEGNTGAIRERRSRSGFFGYQRSLFEAVTGRDAAIDPAHPSPVGYDLVLIGTPVWGWRLSSPVRAYARRHAKRIRRCAFFCTMGGSGDRRAFAELEALLGRRPEATLALTEDEVARIDGDAVGAKITRFVERLRAPVHEVPPTAEVRRRA